MPCVKAALSIVEADLVGRRRLFTSSGTRRCHGWARCTSPGAGLKLDEAGDNQNCAPEAGAQQYSGNCPTRIAVTAPGRFRGLRTIVAERESGICPDV